MSDLICLITMNMMILVQAIVRSINLILGEINLDLPKVILIDLDLESRPSKKTTDDVDLNLNLTS